MKRRGIQMTAAAVAAHQRRHGFAVVDEAKGVPRSVFDRIKLRRSRMNKTEHEYSLILEGRKQRGEINEWRFEAVTLRWGKDPETEKMMAYTPDFTVWKEAEGEPEFHEIKGAFIRSRDFVRFKGCRSDWPRFHFELHQKREGQWVRLL